MKAEKSVTLVYTFVGIVSGIASSYFESIYLSLLLPLVFYAATLPLFLKFIKQKRKKFLTSSMVSFLLWWFVIWILLINI